MYLLSNRKMCHSASGDGSEGLRIEPGDVAASQILTINVNEEKGSNEKIGDREQRPSNEIRCEIGRNSGS